MTGLAFLEITELATLIEKRTVSPVEVTRAMLDRISWLDSDLHSYARVTPERAMATAHEAERAILAGGYLGPLHGVPIGIKDLFWTEGVVTAAGTTIHHDFVPDHDAAVVARLRAAGAIILGKLQMTEGAYSDHHPSVTPPVNPWNANYWTGISSSGPGAALAAGLCYGALASDTGGSIRWPCGANGLTGIKPTWGYSSCEGMFALAPSMDHVGTMARSAADAALLLTAVAGPDVSDPTSLQGPRAPLDDCLAPLAATIGIDPIWNTRDVDAPVRRVVDAAIDVFRSLGAKIVEINVPSVEEAIADWPDLCAVEAAVVHAATFPAGRSEYGPVLSGVLDHGLSISGSDHERAAARRRALAGRFAGLFEQIDLLLCPVQPYGPLTLEELGTMGDQPDRIAKLQRYTCPFDMTGGPTMTLPGGFNEAGMPIGFQLAGGHLSEQALFAAARAFQRATDWHRHHPRIV